MRTSIAIVGSNGVRQKVDPAHAHRLVGKGWATVPTDDPASQDAYAAYVASLSAAGNEQPPAGAAPARPPRRRPVHRPPSPREGEAPDTEQNDAPAADLPEGYRIETSGFGPLTWHTVIAPDGGQIGKAVRGRAAAVQVALEHATAPATA